ncbi:hypothetical protein HDV00_006014 [Rhizophlyctis rosea]|nr:hypothetical protein HDV00_006014 [Rhizophlyctis rosea]
MLPQFRRQRVKAYFAYKAVSAHLFLPVKDEDLSNLTTWTPAKLATYHKRLIRGYVVSPPCHDRRTHFRNIFVPEADRDAKHEKAIAPNPTRLKAIEKAEIELATGPIDGGVKANDPGKNIVDTVRKQTPKAKGKSRRKKGSSKSNNVRGSMGCGDTDWKEDWEEWIQLVKGEFEEQVNTFYNDVYGVILDLVPADKGDGDVKLVIELLVSQNSESLNEDGNLQAWAQRVERAALVFGRDRLRPGVEKRLKEGLEMHFKTASPIISSDSSNETRYLVPSERVAAGVPGPKGDFQFPFEDVPDLVLIRRLLIHLVIGATPSL